MAVGKEIRTKINSVKNTQKITRAMEMVAASKLRKTQDRMAASRPYADREFQSENSGWNFLAQGGQGGTTWDNSDNMYVKYQGIWYGMYLRADGSWYLRGSLNTPVVALENGSAYYYYRRGANLLYTAQP